MEIKSPACKSKIFQGNYSIDQVPYVSNSFIKNSCIPFLVFVPNSVLVKLF